MFHAELYFQIAKQRNKEMVRDAEQWRLLHSSPQTTWLSRQSRRLLRQLGHWLLRIGQPQQQTDRCQHEQLVPWDSLRRIASGNQNGANVETRWVATRRDDPRLRNGLP